MAIIPTAEIPSLSLLYRLRKLEPPKFDAEAAEVAPKPAQSLNDRIGLIRGDITKLKVDAIVNAANKSLRGGGGVDGAIHAAAGPGLLNECRSLHGCNTGSAKITKAYDLPCKKVIHAVGPIWEYDDVDESERLLAGCYATSLKLAVENDCKSIVFSALSTGIYGYPSMDAAPVAIRTVKEFLEGEDGDKLEKVVFCTFVQKDVDAYNHWLPNFFPPVETEESEDQNEDDWQEVKEGESAENGAAEVPVEDSKTDKVELPDVPKADPAEEGHAAKKQKLEATSN